jgi:hypothetical protein
VNPPAPADARPELPPLWQATFDESILDRLFADLESATEVLSIQAKADPRAHAPADPLTLAAAWERLAARAVRGVQVRYRYDGHEWADTVLCAPGGYRLVRMQVPKV